MRLKILFLLAATSLTMVSIEALGQEIMPGYYQQTQCTASGDCGCSQCAAEPLRLLCDPAGCGSRNWVNVNFLYLRPDGYSVPNLVAGSPDGTPRERVGLLDDPATTNLLGNQRLADDWRPGLQIEFGRWLDDRGDKAITGSFFALGNGEDSYTFPGDSNQIVSRPFFNTDPTVNGFDAELVNLPGVVDGNITVATDSDIFSGNIGLQKKLCCCDDRCNGTARRTDFFLGYRMFGADESLTISEVLNPVGGALIPAGTQFNLFDSFETRNRFHGVEFGLTNTWQKRRWTFGAAGKVALGNVNQRVRINGSTTITVPNVAPIVQPIGILASSSNIGEFERDRFGVLTQAQLEIGYWVNNRTRIMVGYNAIYLNDAARPGDHIDLQVNGTQIDPNIPDSGPSSPTFDWVSDGLYLHGFNAGFEFTF